MAQKIKMSELKQIIKEEVDRLQKIKALRESIAKQTKLLKEMEESKIEEYAETQPSDVPGVVIPAGAVDGAAALTHILGLDAMNALEKEIMKSNDHKNAAKLVAVMDQGEQKAGSVNEILGGSSWETGMSDLATLAVFLAPLVAVGGAVAVNYIKSALSKSKADPKAKKAVIDALAKAQVGK